MKPQAWDLDALDALQPSADRSPFGPLATVAEMLQGAHLYSYEHGKQAALVAVRPVRFAAGVRLDVLGLRSIGERLDAARFHAALDRVAGNFDAQIVAMCTQVPHVARACMGQGWTTTGAVLTKIRGLQ